MTYRIKFCQKSLKNCSVVDTNTRYSIFFLFILNFVSKHIKKLHCWKLKRERESNQTAVHFFYFTFMPNLRKRRKIKSCANFPSIFLSDHVRNK